MENLCNQFLIAMPDMSDKTFARSVTYICEHSNDGSMGLIINTPSVMLLGEIYSQLKLSCNDNSVDRRLLTGGPVQPERGFVLHSPSTTKIWESTLAITNDVNLTTSADIMASLAEGEGPTHYLPVLGYAGWEGGQLEEEIANNEWLTVQANTQILFHASYEQRWAMAAKLLGVDLNLISNAAGHA